MAFDLVGFAAECGVTDPEHFTRACLRLRELLEEANRTVNLTRIVAPEAFAVKHVADSLSIARFFPELRSETLHVADIGCGAGFPSLVLALAFPQLRLTAIDSTGKKTAFVERTAATLGLRNCRVITGRSCELNRRGECKHRFDVVTARAVAPARTIWKDARDFPNRNGRFIFYKTPEQAETDLPEVSAASREHHTTWRLTPVFELPENCGSRLFLYSHRDLPA